MPWSNARPGGSTTHARYRSKQHRNDVVRARAQLQRDGIGRCAERVCLMRTRVITINMDLHLCHDRATGAVLGLGHAKCNRSEAARYARSRQNATRLVW